jgi:hypothetical protein
MAQQWTADTLADLVKSTLDDLGRFHLTDISLAKQRYVAMPQILKRKKKMRGGKGLSWNVAVTPGGNARQTGPFEEDQTGVRDHEVTARAPWRFTTNNYSFDLHEEDMNTSDAEQILDLIKMRRQMCMNGLADHLENQIWSSPSASTDAREIWGIPHYVVKNDTQGFNGGNPSGFSDCAGINATTYDQWRNYTAQYTTVTKDNLFDLMADAYYYTGFQAPHNDRIPGYNDGPMDLAIYSIWTVIRPIERILETQNDKLGFDMDPAGGRARFRGVPLTPVTKLEDDSENPVYFIDWSEMCPVFLRGWYMNEHPPKQNSRAHTVVDIHTDMQWNLRCTNRRSQAVLNL